MPKPNRRLWPLLALSALSLLVAACALSKPLTQTTATTPANTLGDVSAICAAWKPISYSARADTQLTVQQVITANALMADFCHPQPVVAPTPPAS